MPKLFEDLVLGRETAFRFLGEEGLAADTHDEDAAAPAHKLAIEAEGLLDGCRQTGGTREVISNSAVVDSNGHDALLKSETRNHY